MPVSSSTVAKEILHLATSEERPLTPLELIKLTYLAHGWSLGFRGQPLASDFAEAWQYGPVFPQLYHKVKAYKANPVQDVPLGMLDTSDRYLTDEDRELIKVVYNHYKRFNGVQLSSITHQPGTPWHDAWERQGRNNIITNDAIQKHYESLIKMRQGE